MTNLAHFISPSLQLHLRKPLIYASNFPFPFRIEIDSPGIDPLLSLFSDLKVDLVRVTTLAIGNRWTVRENIVGEGKTKRIEETPLHKTWYGEVMCSDRGESSWRAEHIDVRVSVIIVYFLHSVVDFNFG